MRMSTHTQEPEVTRFDLFRWASVTDEHTGSILIPVYLDTLWVHPEAGDTKYRTMIRALNRWCDENGHTLEMGTRITIVQLTLPGVGEHVEVTREFRSLNETELMAMTPELDLELPQGTPEEMNSADGMGR